VESDKYYLNYAAVRRRTGPRLAEVGLDIEAWLQEHATRLPTASDIARLEALHMQRQQLLKELQESEERFMDHIVSLLGTTSPSANA
jgi:hypothetical protein